MHYRAASWEESFQRVNQLHAERLDGRHTYTSKYATEPMQSLYHKKFCRKLVNGIIWLMQYLLLVYLLVVE